MIQYNYCPKCGRQIDKNSEPPHCSHCGATYYRNPKATASVFPVKDGKVLLGIRGRDPFKGQFDVIGGFVEPGENAQSAALREAKEETGLDMKIIELLGNYPDYYGEDQDATLNFHFVAEVTGGQMKANDDLDGLKWFAITEAPSDFGFDNNTRGMHDLKSWYNSAPK